MIVVSPQTDNSDAASTNTLVTEKVEKIPQQLFQLVYFSLVASTLALLLASVDNVKYRSSNVPLGVVVQIIAYIWILPHHFAVLLKWLERHQTESIFPFSPDSRRVTAYCFISVALWAGSSAVCARNLYINARPADDQSRCYKVNTPTGYICNEFGPIAGNHGYGDSLASTVTSLVEMCAIISMTALCCMQHRRLSREIQFIPLLVLSAPSDSKVVSV